MVEIAYIRKCKRPVGSGLWAAYELAKDRYGTWLYTPRGSLFRGEDGRSWATCEVSEDVEGHGQPTVHLLSAERWWSAAWQGDTASHRVDVDICTPPRRAGRVWTFDDLELDPFRTLAGEVGTEDWAEFESQVADGHISAAESVAARAACKVVERDLRSGTEPFGRVGLDYLEHARRLDRAPLVDLENQPYFAGPHGPHVGPGPARH